MNDKQDQLNVAPKVGKLRRAGIDLLSVVPFLSAVEKLSEKAVARIELNWSTFTLLMETSIKELYQDLYDIELRHTEEALVRQKITNILRQELSSGFVALREHPYNDEKNSQRLDLMIGGGEKEKKLLSIEIKSDRSKLDELQKDWVKLRNLEDGGRKISIFAGFATKQVYKNNEDYFLKIKDGKHPDYPYVRQIATQHWDTKHVRKEQERRLFIYIWAIDTPKPNMKFDIYEIEDM